MPAPPPPSEPTAPPPLILASTSRYRKQLLERLKLPFTCEAPRCSEDELKALHQDTPALDLAPFLARAKAESLAAAFPDAVILGGDQIALLNGRILDKPGTHEKARAQLAALSGRTHSLLTATCVLHAGRSTVWTDRADLTMRALSAEEIERYLAHDQPYDCAGSYKLESLGISLFTAIRCGDHTAITGLPLLQLCARLRELGYELP